MTTKSYKRASQLSPEERRNQLLRCAITAFAAKGLGRCTHAQVAKLAGVAVPTVFSYFPTREDLVDGVLNEIENTMLGMVRAEIHRDEIAAYEKLHSVLLRYVAAIKEDPDIVKVFLDWTTSFEANLAVRFKGYLDKLVRLLGQIIEQGKSTGEIAADIVPIDTALMIYSSANALAQIQFHHYGVDEDHYILSLINSVLHVQGTAGASTNPIVTKKSRKRLRKSSP